MMNARRIAVALAVWPAASLWFVPHDTAQAQAQYKVGDRVAAPVGALYYDSVVLKLNINVDQVPLTYFVHPIGTEPSGSFTAFPQMLRPWAAVPMEPWGGYTSDPYLTAAQGLPAGSPLPVPPPGQ
jgi:hypothetical protein